MRDIDELLAGVTDVRWNRMEHAFGPAAEVPLLLHGLTDHDPTVRETALDGFRRSVHHQGDVYECTLAALPFLIRIAADTGRPGRADIVRLVASIGGVGTESPPGGDLHVRARNEVAAAAPLWHALLGDPDAEVRAAAVPLLAPTATPATLRERFSTDADPRVRAALVAAVAGSARAGVEVEAAAGWLAAVSTSNLGPAVRLAALTGLAGIADRPGVPTVDVHTALDLLSSVYEREIPGATDLVRAINHGLGDRVGDRLTLLTELLRADNGEARLDALYPAGHLVHGWRGDYTGLVRLIGAQITDPHSEVSERAVYELSQFGQLAAPAADALATALIDADPAMPSTRGGLGAITWVIEWGNGPAIAPALVTLAQLADARALPMLRWALERDRAPRHAPNQLVHYGEQAAELVPLLRRHLNAAGTGDVREDRNRRDDVAHALAAIGPAAAAAVPDLLAVAPTDAIVKALGRIGPAAREALPRLREYATGADRSFALAAAAALWTIDGDADTALSVFGRFMSGDRFDVTAAVNGIGALGPHAAGHADRLHRVLRRKDEHGWVPLAAARALWRIAGDPSGLPVLERTWTTRPLTRLEIATLWGEMGPAAAGCHPYLEAELTRIRRHNVLEHSPTSGDATNDERLLAVCRAVLRKAG